MNQKMNGQCGESLTLMSSGHSQSGDALQRLQRVSLVLVPEGAPGDPDWYGTELALVGRPTRPILVFYRGAEPTPEQVLSFLESQTESCPTP